MFGPEKGRFLKKFDSSTLSTNPTSQLDILGHDGDPLGVNGAEIGIFEQSNKVSLARFLQSHNGRALEAKIGLEILGDLTNQSLEREFANQQLRAFLVATNFTKSNSSRTVTMRLLHTSSCGRALTRSFRRQLFTRGLATGGFASSLLGSCHLERVCGQERYVMERAGRPAYIPVADPSAGCWLAGGTVVGMHSRVNSRLRQQMALGVTILAFRRSSLADAHLFSWMRDVINVLVTLKFLWYVYRANESRLAEFTWLRITHPYVLTSMRVFKVLMIWIFPYIFFFHCSDGGIWLLIQQDAVVTIFVTGQKKEIVAFFWK